MKLQQMRFLVAIADSGFVISRAAERLHTTQSAISKQIRALEQELGVLVLERRGKHLPGFTPAGAKILLGARQMLSQAQAIQAVADEERDPERGSLTIATTHTQSRYRLPPVISRFIQAWPEVSLHMHQGSPVQISELAATGTADFAIATEALELFDDLLMMPCFRWNRSVLVPRGHPLTRLSRISLQDVAAFPLVTYVFGFTGRSKLDEAFGAAGLTPHVVFTAVDADVIKTYVRLGLGVGIIASMAVERGRDDDLVAIDASHLFEDSVTSIGFRREARLRDYMYAFITMFAPHLTRERVEIWQQAVAEGRETAELPTPGPETGLPSV